MTSLLHLLRAGSTVGRAQAFGGLVGRAAATPTVARAGSQGVAHRGHNSHCAWRWGARCLGTAPSVRMNAPPPPAAGQPSPAEAVPATTDPRGMVENGGSSSNRTTVTGVRSAGTGLTEVTWEDGHAAVFVSAWLRDHCHCAECLDQATHQRSFDTATLPDPSSYDLEWAHGAADDGVLRLTASEAAVTAESRNHVIELPMAWLRQHCHADYRPPRDAAPSFAGRPPPVLWSAESLRGDTPANAVPDHLAHLPAISAAELAASPATAGPRLRNNLHRFGVAFISGLDVTDAHRTTDEVVRQFVGFPRETFWGTLWDTAGEALGEFNPEKPPDTAYTSLPLNVHTDCTYLRDPPQLQVFLCETAAESGGETTLRDAFHAAEILWRRSPRAFRFFCETPLPFHCVHDGVRTLATGPPFTLRHPLSPAQWEALLDADGDIGPMPELRMVRYNNDDRAPFSSLDRAAVVDFYRYASLLLEALRDPAGTMEVGLTPGDMVIVNNHRVMHGRRGFADFGARCMVGCYAELDEVDAKFFAG